MGDNVGDNYTEWIIMVDVFLNAESYYDSLKNLASDININNHHSSFIKVANFCIKSGIFFNSRKIGNNISFEINADTLKKHIRTCKPFQVFGNFVEKTVSLHNY